MEGKRGLCGFASTNLDFILGQRKIDNVVLAGFLVGRVLKLLGSSLGFGPGGLVGGQAR